MTKPKRGPGQPTKLTPEVHEKIISAVRAGNFYKAAARYARISPETMYAWIRRGDAERARLDADDSAKPIEREAPYLRFSDAIAEAEAQAEIEAVAHWKSHTRDDWRAAKAWLSVRHRDEWAETTKVEHSGPDGAPITLAGLERLMGVDDDSDTD